MTKKYLSSEKLSLVNVIDDKKNNKFFVSKASKQSFINKVLKLKSFNLVKEYENIFNYIKNNNIKYKTSLLKPIISDVKLDDNLKNNKITEVINIPFTSYKNKGTDYFINKTLNKVIEINKRKPNNIIKVSINFKNRDDLNNDSIINEQSKNINDKSQTKPIIFWLFMIDSQQSRLTNYFNNKKNRVYNIKIKIDSYSRITGYSLADHYRKIQSFKDNGLNLLCVPSAIKSFFEYKKQSSSSIKLIKRYESIIKKLESNDYNKPYSINDLDALAQYLNVSFKITDGINDDIYINKSSFNRNCITLLNNKYNHLELLSENIQEIKENEVNELLKKLNHYTKINNKVYTKDTTYIVKPSNFSIQFNEIKEKYLNSNYIKSNSSEAEYINNYCMSIHSIINPKLYDEYKELIINNDLTEDERNKEMEDYINPEIGDIKEDNNLDCNDDIINKIENEYFKELDIVKAYYNLTNNSEYGVPSNALIYYNDEYSKDIMTHIKNGFVGYYTLNITSQNEKIKYIFNELNNIVLTTPQVMTLINNNIDFDILSCLIAPSINFKFPEETLNRDSENAPRNYAKITGIMMKHEITSNTYIKTDEPEKLIKIINNQNKNIDLSINNDVINITKHKNQTLRHIGFFIHSFVSSQIINLILENDINNILGVKVDSIIIRKNSSMNFDSNIFTFKNSNINNLFNCQDDYTHSYILNKPYINNCTPCIFGDNQQIKNKMVILRGKGGAGKSSDIKNNFSDPDTICYASLAWARGVDFSKDYKCDISSLNRLIGEVNNRKCDKLIKNPFSKIEVIDELTLVNDSVIKHRIKELNEKGKILFIIGDVNDDGFNYQCSLNSSFVDGFKMFNPNDYNCQFIDYTTNYRFDEELNIKLDRLREFMEINKNENNKNELVYDYVLNNFSECIYHKSMINFNRGDMGISAYQESKRNFVYTNYYLEQGAEPRYYVNKTIYNKNIIKSHCSYEKPYHNNYEVRLFESVHSSQGKTCPINNQLLIIIEKNFDYQLLYTALSRARNLKQIKLITGFKTEKGEN